MRPILSPTRWLPRARSFAGSLLPLTALLACSLVANSTWAQAPAKPSSHDTSVVTKDGVEIKMTYFKSTAGQEAPVVILLPSKNGNRLAWKSFAEQLQKVEFAVITVDLRNHGESNVGGKKHEGPFKAKDYLGMMLDLDAVKKFIFEEHQNKQLNMNKLGIVAADTSAPVAVVFTEVDWSKLPYDDAPTPAQSTPRGQDVRALALLSPEENAAGLPTNKAYAMIRGMKGPVLVVAGAKNASDAAAAKKIHDILAPKKEGFDMMYLELYDTKLRGTDLIGKQLKTEQHVFNFLVKHVKELKSEWRDRKSKLAD